MTRPIAVEVALNGPWTRGRQPLIPVTTDEITAEAMACADDGAAVIHVHAYDAETGRQRDDWEIYARIIEGVRARSDALVYPTIPLAGADPDAPALSPAARYAHIAELARRGLIEWAVVDPGTANFVEPDGPGFVYANPPDHIREGLRVCAEGGVRPSFAIYEPGFTRAGALLARGGRRPVYRVMFSEGFAWGFPPEPAFLDAHLALLDRADPGAAWMIAGLAVEIAPLIPAAVARGGMVRVGLEDAPFGTDRGNLSRLREARAAIKAAGGTLETPAALRARLAETDR